MENANAQAEKRNRIKKRLRRLLAYVPIPRELLVLPPILHAKVDNPDFVTPFEFAVISGTILVAQTIWFADIIEKAYGSGGEAIAEEERLDKKFKADWKEVKRARRQAYRDSLARDAEDEADILDMTDKHDPTKAPKRGHTYRGDTYAAKQALDETLRVAGSKEFDRRFKKLLKLGPPEIIECRVSAYQLLRQARLSTRGGNTKKLEASLDRLCRRVGEMDPLIKSWRRLPNGTLKLIVYGDWFHPPFEQISLPLPLKSTTGLAMRLRLRSIKTDAFNKRAMDGNKLCRLLGIRENYMRKKVRALNRALVAVNDSLKKQDFKALDAAKIRIIIKYRIKLLGDNRSIKFVHHEHRYFDDNETAEMNSLTSREARKRYANAPKHIKRKSNDADNVSIKPKVKRVMLPLEAAARMEKELRLAEVKANLAALDAEQEKKKANENYDRWVESGKRPY